MRAFLRVACAIGWHHYAWRLEGVTYGERGPDQVRRCTRCGARA